MYKGFDENVTRPHKIILEGYPFDEMKNLSTLTIDQLTMLSSLLEYDPPRLYFRRLTTEEYKSWIASHPPPAKKSKKRPSSVHSDNSMGIPDLTKRGKVATRIRSASTVDSDEDSPLSEISSNSFHTGNQLFASGIHPSFPTDVLSKSATTFTAPSPTFQSIFTASNPFSNETITSTSGEATAEPMPSFGFDAFGDQLHYDGSVGFPDQEIVDDQFFQTFLDSLSNVPPMPVTDDEAFLFPTFN